MKEIIKKELIEAQSVLEKFITDNNIKKIESAAKEFKNSIKEGNNNWRELVDESIQADVEKYLLEGK